MNQIFLNGITLQQLAEALAPLLQPTTVQTQQAQSEFIGRKEACKILNIGLATLWKYTKAGKIPVHGIGNRILYKREEVIQSLRLLNK